MIIDSVPRLVAQVRDALSEKVLPELPVQTWTAANVRSSISILTWVEDALRLQRPFLIEANDSYRALVRGLLDGPARDWLDAGLRARLEEVSARFADRPAWVDTEALREEHLAWRELATAIIRSSAAARRAGRDADFHAALHESLARLNDREFEISERASKLPPF